MPSGFLIAAMPFHDVLVFAVKKICPAARGGAFLKLTSVALPVTCRELAECACECDLSVSRWVNDCERGFPDFGIFVELVEPPDEVNDGTVGRNAIQFDRPDGDLATESDLRDYAATVLGCGDVANFFLQVRPIFTRVGIVPGLGEKVFAVDSLIQT